MGRKPKLAKLDAANLKPGSMNACPEKESLEHEATITKTASMVNSRYTNTRQSQRLKNKLYLPQDKQNTSEPIDLDESDREEELHIVQSDEPFSCGRTLEEKVDQLVEDVEILKAKVNETTFSDDTPSELSYKTLYIRSQKKIESLAFENGQLSNQLRNALAKNEKGMEESRFEPMIFVMGHKNMKGLVDKLKEVMESNLTKATETLVNLSSQGVVHGSPSNASRQDRVAVPDVQANEKRLKKGNK